MSEEEEECPVCFFHDTDVKLVCGHSFCRQCVKKWYATSHTCPMCRQNIYFKGLYRIKRVWEKETRDARVSDIFNVHMDEIFDLDLDPGRLLFAIACFEHQFNSLKNLVSVDSIEYMLDNFMFVCPYIEKITVYDDNPLLKLIKVSKKKKYVFKKNMYK